MSKLTTAQAHGKERLEVERARFEAGDRMALLAALSICARNELTIPDWAAAAYLNAYREVLNCRVNSWDDVFGKPYPKKHMKDLRRRRKLRPRVWNRINELRTSENPPPIDAGLFERVGDEFGIKKTLCETLYYEQQRILDALLPPK